MGRGASLIDNLMTPESRRRRRRTESPTPHWEPLMRITPAEAQSLMRQGRHVDGTGGALPKQFKNHQLLWWNVPYRDTQGTIHCRYVTVARQREETADGIRYPAYFWYIETQQPLEGEREVTRVTQSCQDLYLMCRLATKKLPGSRLWSPEQQEIACDDAALMIAHRLDLAPLDGCDGIRAGLRNPSRVENDQFYDRAVFLRKKKAEWLAKLAAREAGREEPPVEQLTRPREPRARRS